MTRSVGYQHHRHQRKEPHPEPEQSPQGRGRCHRTRRQHQGTGPAAGARGHTRPRGARRAPVSCGDRSSSFGGVQVGWFGVCAVCGA
nr:MAG TPA: hypothetical protein [Caudoviricetes sp.]